MMIGSAARTAPRRIAIMGHVGNGNLGDEAIIAAVIANLRAAAPDVELIAFTARPQDTAIRHDISAFPIRFDSEQPGDVSDAEGEDDRTSTTADTIRRIPWLKAVLRPAVLAARAMMRLAGELRFDLRSFGHLNGVTLIVFAGSHQVNDYFDGPLGYPVIILRWAMLARLRGAAVSFASIGAGPVTTVMGRFFCARALRLATYRSFRDPSSLAVARDLRAPGSSLLVRDLAFSHPRFATDGPSKRVGDKLRVGINPLPYFGGGYWHAQDKSTYDGYVTAHAELATGLARRGSLVVLFPTQIRVDPATIADILHAAAALSNGCTAGIEVAANIGAVDDLLDEIAGFDLVVATRYHGVLLSLASGVPTVAVAYHQKTRDLMTHMGLESWCVDTAGLAGPALLETVCDLTSGHAAVRASLAAQRGRNAEALRAQYEELTRLAGGGVRAGLT